MTKNLLSSMAVEDKGKLVFRNITIDRAQEFAPRSAVRGVAVDENTVHVKNYGPYLVFKTAHAADSVNKPGQLFCAAS